MRCLFAVVAVLCTFAFGGRLEAHAQNLNFEELAKHPGTEIVKSTINGEQVTGIKRGGVTIWQGSFGLMGVDNSEHGAVLCAWELYVDTLLAIDVCFPNEYAGLKDDILSDIDRINDFVVVNTLWPVRKSELEERFATRRARMRSQSSDFMQTRCEGMRRENSRWVHKQMEPAAREERAAQIEKLLSVPRPPVMNPCL